MTPRRQIFACLAALAAAVLMLGCGSDDGGEDPNVSSVAAGEISAKLDLIQERYDEQDCEGADSALASLTEDVPDVDANQAFKDDLTTLLGDLQEQISSDCSGQEESTSTSSTSSSTKDDTETTETTESTTTETTTEETTDETTESTSSEEEPATPEVEETPPSNPGGGPPSGTPPAGGGTGGESGGVSPGFESGRNLGG